MKKLKTTAGPRSCWLIALLLFTIHSKISAQKDEGRTIMNIPGYPSVFELNVGEQHRVTLHHEGKVLSRDIKLISIKPYFEPYYLFPKGDPKIYSKAEVVVEVSGKRITLVHRPYQMPVEFEGLRLYIEAIREWAISADYADLKDIKGDVRLSVCAAGETWGPPTFRFPINDYRWKAGVYQNTWSALVPYNLRYYHRGEDYGAIPDKLDVISPFDGKIIGSPLPDGDGQSNAIYIQNASGITFRVAHMNIETIKKFCQVGTDVKSGTILAKTGMTWDGRKSQDRDSHCHTELQYKGMRLASYPYLMEAYLRTYPDKVIAVAGGYQYTVVGKEMTLDATRSIVRKGERIKSYAWKLHNGEIRDSSTMSLRYEQPGLYTEELIVTTQSGAEDRDFLQVRVFDTTKQSHDIAYGWAAYDPVRHIHPNSRVLFWNRLAKTKRPVTINFGDGSDPMLIDRQVYHRFSSRGRYVVTLSSSGPSNEPVTIEMEVVVE